MSEKSPPTLEMLLKKIGKDGGKKKQTNEVRSAMYGSMGQNAATGTLGSNLNHVTRY